MAQARTTVERTARRIQRQLSAGTRPQINQLSQPLSMGDTTVKFSYPLTNQLVNPGALIEIDREMMRVVDIDAPNKACTVLRQWYDTEASDHGATAEIRINPRWALAEIFDEMITEIQAWPPELFRVYDATFTVASTASNVYGGIDNFELPANWVDMYRVIDVRKHSTLGVQYSPVVDTTWPAVRYRLQHGSIAGFGAARLSGQFLRFLDPVSTGSLYVSVARPFDLTTFELETDLVGDCGIPETMLDILTMGVRMRLIGFAEHASSSRDAQGASPNGGDGVQATTATRDQAAVFGMYMRRRSEEANRLRLAYPVRNY